MTVLSDKWTQNSKIQTNDQPFVDKQVRKGKYLLDYHLTIRCEIQ